VLAVAPEELVGAGAREQHLDPCLPGGLADQERVDRGRVADRLVEGGHHPRQHVGDVGLQLDLVQAQPQLVGEAAGVVRVVGHRLQAAVGLPEGDRPRLDGRILAVRQGGDDARVEPPGEQGGDRDVGDQVRPDRLLQDAAQRRPDRVLRGRGDDHRVPEGVLLHPTAGVVRLPGARRELAHPGDRAAVGGQPAEEGGGDHPGGVDAQLASDHVEQRLQLGGEQHPVAARQDVERLDPERVARQGQGAGALVVHRQREHPAERRQRRRPPHPPGLQHHLRVGAGGEDRAVVLQLGAQLTEVVELAVVDQRQAAA
jgi:hypothetical protein